MAVGCVEFASVAEEQQAGWAGGGAVGVVVVGCGDDVGVDDVVVGVVGVVAGRDTGLGGLVPVFRVGEGEIRVAVAAAVEDLGDAELVGPVEVVPCRFRGTRGCRQRRSRGAGSIRMSRLSRSLVRRRRWRLVCRPGHTRSATPGPGRPSRARCVGLGCRSCTCSSRPGPRRPAAARCRRRCRRSGRRRLIGRAVGLAASTHRPSRLPDRTCSRRGALGHRSPAGAVLSSTATQAIWPAVS